MLKKDARFHYGILKHRLGDKYENDCLMLSDDYKPISFIYRESAQYQMECYKKKYPNCTFKIVRLD